MNTDETDVFYYMASPSRGGLDRIERRNVIRRREYYQHKNVSETSGTASFGTSRISRNNFVKSMLGKYKYRNGIIIAA